MRAVWLGMAAMACAYGARTGLDTISPKDASVPDVVDAGHPHDAAPDVAPPIDATPDVPPPLACTVYDAGPPVKMCKAFLRVGAITPSSSTCYVDSIIHEGDEGLAWFDCAGSTDKQYPTTIASASFPGGTFDGARQNDSIDLCSATTFTWSDGCTWASAQRIEGDLDQGTLTYTYTEAPIDGTSCDPPCDATGTVFVQ